MAAQIKLKRLTGIQINDKKAVVDGTSPVASDQTLLNSGISGLSTANQKVIFAGQDYKGTFTTTDHQGKGDLELHLERPENHFTIKGVKIKKSGTHALTNNGKDAIIELANTTSDKISITEEDCGWFKTGLTFSEVTTKADSSLKFGEWNDYDLPDKCYVEISFA